MEQENNQNTEMSVEEILSSIRQILTAEEENPQPAPVLEPETGDDAHLFVDQPIDWTGGQKVEKPSKPVFVLTPQMQIGKKAPLLSKEAQEKMEQAFVKLSELDDQKKEALTLNEAQIEMQLRPLLKEWIDKNMPDLVEKIVTREVQQFLKK